MEYVTLNNGVQLPMIGFGTWDVRGEAGKKTILTALDSGYRLIDTGQMYENEDIVGQAVKRKRSGEKRGLSYNKAVPSLRYLRKSKVRNRKISAGIADGLY